MEIKQIKADGILQVVRLFDQYRIFYKQPSDIALAQKFLRERLDNNESIIFVAIADLNGQPVSVGFTQLYPQYSSMRATKNWILNDLYVDEQYRENGIGELLIRKAIAFAKDTKATFLQLETNVHNFTAQKLYEKIGFQQQAPDQEFLVYKLLLV